MLFRGYVARGTRWWMHRLACSIVVALALSAPAVAATTCVKGSLLESAGEEQRAAMLALDEACAEGLRLVREGRPAEALPLLRKAAEQPNLLSRDLRLPVAEAMFGAGSPVEATLVAWEGVEGPERLVVARRLELVERLAHGRAAELLAADQKRASAVMLEARARRDTARPVTVEKRVVPNRVGVLLPLSGRLSSLGARILRGMRLALDGSTTLVVRDTGSGAVAAPGLVGELVEDGVVAILGPVDRMVAAAAAEAAEERGVPIVRLSVEDEETRKRRWVFRAFLSRRGECRALVAHARRQGLGRFAILHTDSGWGAALARTFASEVEKAGGGEVVATISYGKDALALTHEAKELRRTPADAIFLADKAARAGLVLRFLAREDIWTRGERKHVARSGDVRYVQIYGPSEWLEPAIPEDDVRYLRGVVAASEWPAPDDPRVVQLGQRTKDGFGEEAGLFEAVGYDAVLLVQGAQAHSRDAVAERLRKDAGVDGVMGALRFDEDGEPSRPVRLFRAGKGRFEPVLPAAKKR